MRTTALVPLHRRKTSQGIEFMLETTTTSERRTDQITATHSSRKNIENVWLGFRQTWWPRYSGKRMSKPYSGVMCDSTHAPKVKHHKWLIEEKNSTVDLFITAADGVAIRHGLANMANVDIQSQYLKPELCDVVCSYRSARRCSHTTAVSVNNYQPRTIR